MKDKARYKAKDKMKDKTKDKTKDRTKATTNVLKSWGAFQGRPILIGRVNAPPPRGGVNKVLPHLI